MAETPRGYPYPGGGEAPDGPFAFQALADAVDADVDFLEARVAENEEVATHQFDRSVAGATISGADIPLVDGTITDLRPGVYRIEGWSPLKSDGGVNGSAYVQAGVTKRYVRQDLIGVWTSVRAVIPHYVHAGGNLYICFGYDAPTSGQNFTLATPTTKTPTTVVLTQVGKTDVA